MPVPKGSTLDPDRTRAAILRTAGEFLYARGLDGVGVAELCAEAGISKETLYRHFGSKDGLIQAVLEARSDRVTHWLSQVVADAGDEPAAQLAAVFDALGRWYEEPGFRGCAIVNAATQRHATPVDVIATRHLGRYLELLTQIATRAGVADPAALGRRFLLLLEGATVVADHQGVPGVADDAREAALTLLESETKATKR
ncbi:TetR/AcrR family transcriptional regulator [Actinomadura sp. B10D3]|uniref:TetR/AcrR family transcriptional regulator n=1 Tax=Actinomadura sp. B10D3 TaxID=3153557 RepID=UPI00325EE632